MQGYRQYDKSKNKHENLQHLMGFAKGGISVFSARVEIDEHVRLSLQFWYKKRTDSLSNELAASVRLCKHKTNLESEK